jgi:DNA-binding CsgD family transcriptional regulator
MKVLFSSKPEQEKCSPKGIGAVTLTLVGACCALVQYGFVVWSSDPIITLPGFTGDQSSLFRTVSTLANICAFGLTAILGLLSAKTMAKHLFKTTAIVALFGVLFATLAKLFLAESSVLLAISGVFLGLGSGFSLLSWHNVFYNQPERLRSPLILGSFACFVLPPILISYGSAFASLLILAGIIMPTNLVCLFIVGHKISQLKTSVEQIDRSQKRAAVVNEIKNLKPFVTPLLAIVGVALMAPIVATIAPEDALSVAEEFLLTQLGCAVAVVALFILWIVIKARPSTLHIYLVVLPLYSAVLIISPFTASWFSYLLVLLSTCGFMLSLIVLQVACIELSGNKPTQSLMMFGISGWALFLVQFLGSILAGMMRASGYSREMQFIGAAFFLAYVCLMGAFFVNRALSPLGTPSRAMSHDSSTVLPKGENSAAARCGAFAEEYALSGRETEVLLLLSEGRNVPQIARLLFITKNTAETHVRHIYRKMKVHTRQELIDMISGS